MAPKTGNICFERNLFKYTRSQIIVYVVENTAYVYDTKELWAAIQKLAKEGKTDYRKLGDGDRNPAILVKMADIIPLAEEVTLEEQLGGEKAKW